MTTVYQLLNVFRFLIVTDPYFFLLLYHTIMMHPTEVIVFTSLTTVRLASPYTKWFISRANSSCIMPEISFRRSSAGISISSTSKFLLWYLPFMISSCASTFQLCNTDHWHSNAFIMKKNHFTAVAKNNSITSFYLFSDYDVMPPMTTFAPPSRWFHYSILDYDVIIFMTSIYGEMWRRCVPCVPLQYP